VNYLKHICPSCGKVHTCNGNCFENVEYGNCYCSECFYPSHMVQYEPESLEKAMFQLKILYPYCEHNEEEVKRAFLMWKLSR